jgi:hypothetical protein
MLSVPLTAFEPLHAPLAVQAVASVDDHVSADEAPRTRDVGLAAIITVGGKGFAVTVAEALALPPAPVHVSV